MPYWTIDHSDGRYSLAFEQTSEEASTLEDKGHWAHYFRDGFLAAYRAHCALDTVFQDYFRLAENEKYLRKRERELLPIEAANREIERLKKELEAKTRTAKFFEDEWSKMQSEATNRTVATKRKKGQ